MYDIRLNPTYMKQLQILDFLNEYKSDFGLRDTWIVNFAFVRMALQKRKGEEAYERQFKSKTILSE